MNRLLFGDNLKWLRDTKVFPDAPLLNGLPPSVGFPLADLLSRGLETSICCQLSSEHLPRGVFACRLS
jgi:hypothetical protein